MTEFILDGYFENLFKNDKIKNSCLIIKRYPVVTTLCFVSCFIILIQYFYICYWQSLLLDVESQDVISNPFNKQELKNAIEKYSIKKEILISLSTINLIQGNNILEKWLENVLNAGIENYIIIALDEKLEEYLINKNINTFYYPKPKTIQEGTGLNHEISSLKYQIIAEILEQGYNVFLSDMDVIFFKNPFLHLYHDSDIEGMSDGYDDKTAYGIIETYDDPEMGWSRYSQGFKHHNLNSGIFYIKSNLKTLNLMKRISHRLQNEVYWDQTAFNEEIFSISHDAYFHECLNVRIMNIYDFMNSKVLFKYVRFNMRMKRHVPILVHLNYHPDKYVRMEAIEDYYWKHNLHALDQFPIGSAVAFQ